MLKKVPRVDANRSRSFSAGAAAAGAEMGVGAGAEGTVGADGRGGRADVGVAGAWVDDALVAYVAGGAAAMVE